MKKILVPIKMVLDANLRPRVKVDGTGIDLSGMKMSINPFCEIAVEEAVSHVIRRLSNEVKTPGLIKLTAITTADCESMRDGFKRCSELLHSAAPALNRPLPRPEALTKEIDAMVTWMTNLQQRQNAVKLR